MLLLGEAGFGKSAFAAQLVDETMKDCVIAYHFCSDEDQDTLEQKKFVYGLVISLARIDGFKTQLMTLLENQLKEGDTELNKNKAYFDESGLDLFKKVTRERGAQGVLNDYVLPALCKMDEPEDGKNRLLVVDSLDEAALAGETENTIVGLVTELAKSKKFPSWLKLLITSRPQDSVTSELDSA
eukprot:CAMPEP_0182496984 /NCGR_PEP_ID=MMETSP1321-20130603/5550_1 /TAXON_ID=91990 /ORGANISM="Bolidomonas sp., Strain RCC1657" /LENGTH=183 /DNA_ID=CAMNT_0024700741 /DNA_START=45 /DNA_END=593 /DNA_ORIENTATION=-